MDTSKIIKGVVSNGRYTVTAPIIKEDYGLYLQIEGVELPSTYEVDFSNSEHNGTSVTMIGNADGVLIPRQFIASGKDVFAFLYHVGEDFGRTVYKFRIPNKVRPDRTNEEPTPEEQSVIDQVIASLNDAVDRAEDAEQAIEDMSVSATTLAEGSSATVTKTESEGVVHLEFGIPRGATGAQGDKGDKGDKGDTGAQGIKGDKGDTGAQGIQGEKGEKGDKGDKGDTGEVTQAEFDELSGEVSDLKEELNNLSSGKIAVDLIESQKQKGDIYSNIKFEEGYTVNSSNGTIGSTSNMRYFATNVALKESAIVIGCEKIIVKCNTDYIARFTYGFFNRDHVLIGSVVTINPVAANEFELTVPDGAYYLHCGGYGTTTANTPTACTTTFVYGVTSFFVGKLDEQLTSETLPAQGKATGTRIGALETLKDTTGLSKLRVIPNANSINFVARTGLTNLFVGYGAGANTVEDYPDGTPNSLNTYDGSFNVAVGFEAMNANVGGDHCTAVGYTALKQNINGDYNTCMGEDALYNNQYGSYNVAIGDHALMSNEGDSNTAIGASVARSITGVDDSIMLGSYAGVNMSGSKHNIAIGNRSGVASGVTHDCIIIGNDASATEDKQIVIGTSVHESVVIAGKRFVTPTVTITPITGGHRITITDADGEHSADVMDGTGSVDDVQMDGTSIVQNGVANIPYASNGTNGLVRASATYGTKIDSDGVIRIQKATESETKAGVGSYHPITTSTQHAATFYGLAKSAGDTTQSQSSNAVGNYTDTAKGKIQTMLGIADLIGNNEGATASQAYSVGDVLLHDGKLYKVTASITQGSAIVPNTNCTQTTIIDLMRGV